MVYMSGAGHPPSVYSTTLVPTLDLSQPCQIWRATIFCRWEGGMLEIARKLGRKVQNLRVAVRESQGVQEFGCHPLSLLLNIPNTQRGISNVLGTRVFTISLKP